MMLADALSRAVPASLNLVCGFVVVENDHHASGARRQHRWRDFANVYMLNRSRPVDSAQLHASRAAVACHAKSA
jgi:hypothetical protein